MTRRTGFQHDARELQRITGRSYQGCCNHLRGLTGDERRQVLEQATGKLAEALCQRIRTGGREG